MQVCRRGWSTHFRPFKCSQHLQTSNNRAPLCESPLSKSRYHRPFPSSVAKDLHPWAKQPTTQSSTNSFSFNLSCTAHRTSIVITSKPVERACLMESDTSQSQAQPVSTQESINLDALDQAELRLVEVGLRNAFEAAAECGGTNAAFLSGTTCRQLLEGERAISGLVV